MPERAQRTGSFDPTAYRGRYQEALRELIEAKMKGLAIQPRAVSALGGYWAAICCA